MNTKEPLEPPPDPPLDPPLDPEVEIIRKKMMRLLIVSSGIMIVGLLAVFFAIVYKVNEPFNELTTKQGTITLPENSRILDTSLYGNNIVFTIQDQQGRHSVLVYENGELKQKYSIDGIKKP